MAFFEGYRLRGTWIDRLDPRTKLAWLALVVILALVSREWTALIILPAVVLLSGLAAGLPFRTFRHPLIILVVVGLQLLVVQLIFSTEGRVIAQIGFLEIYSGAFPLAGTAFLRLSAIVLAAMQFLRWTPPGDLTLLLVKAKIPYRFAMLAGLALRFLPLMERELGAILESQSTRGMPMKTASQKLKSLLPVALPFIYRSFRRANETALAMELRGFGRHPERTFLYDLELGRLETVAISIMAAGAVWGFWQAFW